MDRLYLDHAATSPVRPEVQARMVEVMAEPGNASSVHREGRAARRILEDARAVLAAALGAMPDGVIFTSGGTEANDLALASFERVLVAATEHASVLDAVPEAPRIPVAPDGRLDLQTLDELLAAHRPGLVSVMLVNNETGVIQPIQAIAARCHAAGALLHVDAVQALGKLPEVTLDCLDADILTVSGHKLGGPQGVGALVLRDGVEVTARLRGGGQELRRRAGTHNLPGIAGFATALAHGTNEPERLRGLRALLRDGLARTCPTSRLVADGAPHIASILTPSRPAAVQVMQLDLAGIAVSAGAACSSGKVGPSHVLAAMGLGADAACAIRVSLGWTTTVEDIERFVRAFAGLMHARTPGRAA